MSTPEALERVQRALGVELGDPGLLELALTHRSFAFEAGGVPTNERLEFLGDAVLGLVVTDLLYRMLPESPEGRLAKIRAAAVNAGSLAAVARDLGVGDAVLLGRGEELSGGREKGSILADALEAMIGAVYVDRGIEEAAALVERLFAEMLFDLAHSRESLDFKTSLQELTAAQLGTLPVYEIDHEGPDHAKRFAARAVVDGVVLGRGAGRSKKEAEQAAAQQALAAMRSQMADAAVEESPRPRDASDGRTDAVLSPRVHDEVGGSG